MGSEHQLRLLSPASPWRGAGALPGLLERAQAALSWRPSGQRARPGHGDPCPPEHGLRMTLDRDLEQQQWPQGRGSAVSWALLTMAPGPSTAET